jgi:hypothetical protein
MEKYIDRRLVVAPKGGEPVFVSNGDHDWILSQSMLPKEGFTEILRHLICMVQATVNFGFEPYKRSKVNLKNPAKKYNSFKYKLRAQA